MIPTDIPSILVVDDRPENLLSIEALLEGSDCDIVKVTSGQQALREALKKDFALVHLDVQMPDMDGFETAELLRSSNRTKYIPIIFVTAISKEQYHVFKGYESGAVDYLLKPIEPNILRNKVKVFLELGLQRSGLKKINQELSKLNESKSRFVSAASHELRTPLAIIREFVSLVNDEVPGPINDDQRECLASALRNCDRLGTLIDDLLDMSRIESGKLTLQRKRINVKYLLEQIVKDFAPTCIKKNHSLVLTCQDGLPDVLCDPNKITQVTINLLSNAHKFTPENGTIDIKACLIDKFVAIDIIDMGVGLRQQDLMIIFEKFTQIHREARPGTKGTGLGLPIARELIKLHGGTIDVKSKLNQGSTFSFTIPIYSKSLEFKSNLNDLAGVPLAEDKNVIFALLKLKLSEAVDTKKHKFNFDELRKEIIAFVGDNINSVSDSIITTDEDDTIAVLLVADQIGGEIGMNRVYRLLAKSYGKLLQFEYGISAPLGNSKEAIDLDDWIESANKDMIRRNNPKKEVSHETEKNIVTR